jgi:hypothetical protein
MLSKDRRSKRERERERDFYYLFIFGFFEQQNGDLHDGKEELSHEEEGKTSIS